MQYPLDLTGLQFARLCVVARAGSNWRGDAMWSCSCECGGKITTRRGNLVGGYTKSCGCLHIETAALLGRNSRTHGFSNTREYFAWHNMIDRCFNIENDRYAEYGGRGISICDRWRDVANFITDMGLCPSPELSLDRINNDGNYEPLNCRWATDTQQMRNRRNTAMNMELAGDLKRAKSSGVKVSHWARDHGINIGTAFAVTRGITWKEV